MRVIKITRVYLMRNMNVCEMNEPKLEGQRSLTGAPFKRLSANNIYSSSSGDDEYLFEIL